MQRCVWPWRFDAAEILPRNKSVPLVAERESARLSFIPPGVRSTWQLTPAQPLLCQCGEVLGPALVALGVQRLKVGPGVKAGVVAVVEDDAHCVVADRLELLDLDVALLADRHALLGGMALHLGGG